jgi:hypothetical protein
MRLMIFSKTSKMIHVFYRLFLYSFLYELPFSTFFMIHHRYVLTHYVHERESIMVAMASVARPALVTRTLDFVFSGSVRSQDIGSFLIQLNQQPHALLLTWKRFQLEWDWMVDYLPPMMISNVIKAFGKAFSAPELRDELKDFLTQHPYRSGSAAVSWAFDYADANVAFMSNNAETVKTWLKAHLDSQ